MSANLAPCKPDISTPARATAVAFEDSNRLHYLEHGVIIAPDGWRIATAVGYSNKLSFPNQKLSLVADITVTHNHPHRHSFSYEDIELAVEFQMREIRCVTRDHRHFAWGFAGVDLTRIASEYIQLEPYGQHQALGLAMAGAIPFSDAKIESVHYTWTRVSKTLGFHYEREPS